MPKSWFILLIAAYSLLKPWCACGAVAACENGVNLDGCAPAAHLEHLDGNGKAPCNDLDHEHDQGPVTIPGQSLVPAPVWVDLNQGLNEFLLDFSAIRDTESANPWSNTVDRGGISGASTQAPEVLCVFLA